MRISRGWLVAFLLQATVLIGCSQYPLKEARNHELAGNDEAALHSYQRALAKTPKNDRHGRSILLTSMGKCLYRMDRFPEAFAAFKKAAEADGTNSEAHLRLGKMLLEAGSAEGAREEALQVLTSAGNNNDALALLGAAWAAADNPAMAKAVYQRVLKSDPKQVKVAVALADIYNEEDDREEARGVLQNAAAAQPSSALPWLALGRLEEEEGNGAQAEKAYRRAVAVEDTPETNFRLAQFLERSARITEAQQVLRRVDAERRRFPLALGDFQLASEHPGDALQQFRSAMAQIDSAQPGNVQRSKDQARVAARTVEAEIYSAEKKEGAERSAALLAAQNQVDDDRRLFDPATIAILQTELALAGGKLIQAQSLAKTAIELAPDSAAAYYVSGTVEAAFGNESRAQKEWERSLDNDPHYLPSHLALADAALRSGDAKDADVHARRVVREDPSNFHAVMIFSRALLMENMPSLAAVMAERASALNPQSVEPSIVLGDVALRTGRVSEALLLFERAVIEHPDSESAIDGLLRVYRRGRMSYAMLENMERVAIRPPVSATLLEIVGRLYADHGWYAEAIRALNEALKAEPRRITAARLLAHLELATGENRRASELASRMGTAHDPLLRAYEAEQTGNWQRAIVEYEKSITEGDQTGTASNNLAWLYAEHHLDLDRALMLAQSAAKFSPEDPAVLDTLGFVELQRRNYSNAVSVLETAARISEMKGNTPEDRRVARQIRQHLGDAYLAVGKTDAALELAQNRGPFALK
jgi:tetratricopeptide (TPR) repeat protein